MAASVQENSAIATSAGREIVITRVFDAPCEMVFDAWTNPKHLVHWFGPMGFRTTIQQMDVRPGGEWRLVMHGPDGRDFHNRIVYVEVARPHRLVYRNEPEEGTEPVTFETAVTFEDRDGKTLLTLTHTFPTAALREQNEMQNKSVEGGRQTLGRLADYLPIQASRESGRASREIVITRVFDAPREVLFRAWTDATELAKWWGPHHYTNSGCACDPRVGGEWRVLMTGPNGIGCLCSGVYQEVVPPELLVFTNDATDDQGNLIITGHTRVSFAKHDGGKTLLTLTTRATAMTEQMITGLMGMYTGWSQSLERLDAEVTNS